MSDADFRVRAAFDELQRPQDLDVRTLRTIEQARLQQVSLEEAPADFAGLEDATQHSEGSAPVSAGQRAHPVFASARPASHSAGQDGIDQRTPKRELPRRVFLRRAMLAAAACLALVAAGTLGVRWYAQPTAYIGIDVNPSIELSVNRFNRVVAAEGVNDDGRALLESVSLENRAYADAVRELTESAAFASYAEADSYVEFSITCDDEPQAQELQDVSDACVRSLPCEGTCRRSSAEERTAARASGMCVGRYRAACELVALDSSLTLDDCAEMSMRELRDRIAACEGNAAGASLAGGSGNDCGSGHGSRGHGQRMD